MNEALISNIVQQAVNGALAAQKELVDGELKVLRDLIEVKTQPLSTTAVQAYEPIVINREIKCEHGLDAVKSLPTFNGSDKSEYLPFRTACYNAIKIYDNYKDSVKYYEAVSIVRNKITGAASNVLTGYYTPFNFDAFMSRLDREYGDKRPLHLLEQEMSTLRQGSWSVNEYYDKVQLKLSAITNKTVLSYNSEFASQLNDKYRQDALRVFISGLKRGLSDTLFASRPADLPSALALAEELEGNRERHQFAMNFQSFSTPSPNNISNKIDVTRNVTQVNPNFTAHNKEPPRDSSRNLPRPEPMEVDQSLRTRFGTNLSGKIDKGSFKGKQSINNISADNDDYQTQADECEEDLLEQQDACCENLYFLEANPCSRS